MYREEIKNIIIKELSLNPTKDLYKQCRDRYNEIRKLYNKTYLFLDNKNIKLKNAILLAIDYEITDNKRKFPEKLYHIINNIYEIPKCLECNNKVKFKVSFKKGYCDYCSMKCRSNSKKVKEKQKQTNVKKYGTEYGFQSDEIKNKIKQTNLLKYGTEYIQQSEKIKEKIKKINIEKYGGHHSQNKEIQNKIKETNLEIYGVKRPLQNKEIKEKVKQTCLNKYGKINPRQNKLIKNKIKTTVMKNSYNNFSNILSKYYEFLFSEDEYVGRDFEYKFKCKICNNEFKRNFNNVEKGVFHCPYCYPGNRSIGEQEIYNWLCSIINKNDIIINDRSVLKNKELDIYIPKYNFAIEYNGIYWHSLKDKYYHYNKTNECNSLNIDLLHIFEDEDIDVIKSIIYRKLNNIYKFRPIVNNIKLISKEDVKGFVKINSLNSYIECDINLGYFYNNRLISTCSIKNNIINNYSIKNYWNINTFNVFMEYIKQNYNFKNIYYKLNRQYEFLSDFNYNSYKKIPLDKYKNNKFEIYNSGYYLIKNMNPQKRRKNK